MNFYVENKRTSCVFRKEYPLFDSIIHMYFYNQAKNSLFRKACGIPIMDIGQQVANTLLVRKEYPYGVLWEVEQSLTFRDIPIYEHL